MRKVILQPQRTTLSLFTGCCFHLGRFKSRYLKNHQLDGPKGTVFRIRKPLQHSNNRRPDSRASRIQEILS